MARVSSSISVVFVGAGPVATALALRLRSGGYRIAAVISRRRSSARRLARLVGAPVASCRVTDLCDTPTLILIAVPDRQIVSVARELASVRSVDLSSSSVFHTSGALSSDDLAPMSGRCAAIGSLHPIQTFPPGCSPRELRERTRRLTYVFEGEKHAERAARRLVRMLGGRLIRIPKVLKIPYHIACVMASNYAVTLIGAVDLLLEPLGRAVRRGDLRRLTETSLARAFDVGPGRALTGPVVRGDAETIRRHLSALQRAGGPAALYRALGVEALGLAVRSGRLRPADAARLRRLLRP